MSRCGACSQRAGAAANTPANPVMFGPVDDRLRRVQVRAPLRSYGESLVPGAVVYATGVDIDLLIAAGALAVV